MQYRPGDGTTDRGDRDDEGPGMNRGVVIKLLSIYGESVRIWQRINDVMERLLSSSVSDGRNGTGLFENLIAGFLSECSI